MNLFRKIILKDYLNLWLMLTVHFNIKVHMPAENTHFIEHKAE